METQKFTPKYYKGFVDDITVLFEKPEHLLEPEQFAAYITIQHHTSSRS